MQTFSTTMKVKNKVRSFLNLFREINENMLACCYLILVTWICLGNILKMWWTLEGFLPWSLQLMGLRFTMRKTNLGVQGHRSLTFGSLTVKQYFIGKAINLPSRVWLKSMITWCKLSNGSGPTLISCWQDLQIIMTCCCCLCQVLQRHLGLVIILRTLVQVGAWPKVIILRTLVQVGAWPNHVENTSRMFSLLATSLEG
jgi:hypothetical protein